MFIVSVEELLSWIDEQLNNGGSKESLFLMLDIVSGLSKKDLNYLKINPKQQIKLKENLDNLSFKWEEHIYTSRPIQHICNKCYWRDLKLQVSSKTLIPRVETELIIDIANDLLKFSNKRIYFTDLGTGTGAIGIALAIANPDWVGIATDIDKQALKIARKNFLNCSKNNNLSFAYGDWWNALKNSNEKFDLVVSNPPYIPENVFKDLPIEVKEFEPKIALNGGEEGLDHIVNIVNGAPRFLRECGWLIIENHFDHSHKVKSIFSENGFHSVKTINDLSGIGRFTIGRYK